MPKRSRSQLIRSTVFLKWIYQGSAEQVLYSKYSLTCVNLPLSKRQKIGFQNQLLLNAGQKYGRMLLGEHSAILLTIIKLLFVICIFVFVFLSGHFTQVLLYTFEECSGSVGRALDWGSKGFVSLIISASHCVVTLSKALYLLLSTGSTQEDPSQHD